ncbi:MAG: type I DNA topoisomerase [Candidatus Magasanikbacteria bacterium]|nr:type I DNA topoisomerase [Candidatus Magasanikbacteria bacterium]
MSKTLVIVESPTKAKTISKFLGTDYVVESSFGHVRDLPKSNMGIDIEGGTFLPTYRVSPDKTKQVKKLKDLAKECDNNIIFATDEDREGEAIAWHLAHILKVKPEKAERIVFHEITKHAIEEALKHPRHINTKLVDAQQARRVLDRLVGYELSPFLWKKIARGLSAGRVQSVAVRLIVERERERDAFESQEYWTIAGHFDAAGAPLEAKLTQKNGEKLDKFAIGTKADADAILDALKDAKYKVLDVAEKDGTRTPPAPYRTSTLQQQSNNKLGYSSKQTMRLAQQLYEGIHIGKETVGLITYMRTDSTNLSAKFLKETAAFVKDTFGKEYALDKPREFTKKTKGAQEAHEAIRPTHPERTPESLTDHLDPQQLKLYSLIYNRAVASQMAEAKVRKATLDVQADGSDKHSYEFRATGQTITFKGWLALYPEALKELSLPDLKKGDELACTDLIDEQHFTQPPARYSDATLVKALEEHGIGRPSTYSPTIGTIEARKYVARDDNKKFYPQSSAIIVTDMLIEHFSDIVDYSFTALMEENLDAIAEGTKDWQPIISTFYHPFHDNLEKKNEEVTREELSQMRELGTDEKTGKPVYVRIGQYGPFVQLGSKDDEEKPRFAALREGQIMQTITMEEAMVLLSLPRTLGQEEDGADIKANVGRFGPYVQVGKEYFSIKKDMGLDPYTISLEEAVKIVKDGREEKAKRIIKVFEEEGITIKRGPYGVYVTDGTKNGRIPKDLEDPSTLTLEDCQKILAEAKPGRGKKKAAAKKKAAPKKAAAKKKATPKKKAAKKKKSAPKKKTVEKDA